MANRAERRRMMRQMEKQNALGLNQTQMESSLATSKDEIERLTQAIENEKARLSSGYAGMAAARDADFRRKLEAHDKARQILEHNGITAQDLEDSFEEGRKEGFRQAAEPVIKCCYAGIILALHDEFGFGENRAFRAIKAVDEKIIWALNHSELCDEVLKKTGLELLMDEPFDRVQKRENGKC